MTTTYKINGREVSRDEFSAGSERRLHEMLESRRPPMSNTDREFLEGRGGCYDQFGGNEFIGEFHRREAKRQGVDTAGKVYMHGLADYPGDPRAWVSGRGDVQRVCEERGWGCEGSVNVPLTRVAELTGGGVAEDIVAAEVAKRLEANPEARPADVREAAVNDLKPHWAKNAE